MMIMAWDHSKDFLAIYKGQDGTQPDGAGPLFSNHTDGRWYGVIDEYSGSSYYLLARFVSHFCAPAFSLLMGTGMVLMSQSRRVRAGWSSGRLLRFFNLRGFILIILGFVVRMSMWIQLIHPTQRFAQFASGGGGGGPVFHRLFNFWQVMTALGLQMIALSWILAALHALEHYWLGLGGGRRLRLGASELLHFGFQPACLAFLSLVCFTAMQLTIHTLQNGDPSTAVPPVATTFGQVLVRFLMVPGPFGAIWITQAYPFVPWLAICLMGAAMGLEFKQNPALAHKRALINGLLLLLAFVLIRTLGGSALNLRGLPLGEATDAPLVGFWLLCKYPPSLAYSSLTVGANLVGLYLFSLVDATQRWAHVVLHFGRAPLVFYVTHFYVINIIALLISVSGQEGVPLGWVVPIWMCLLVLMYQVCYYYDKFKHGKDVNSLWHLF